MESKVSYTLVGIFVLVLGLGFIAGVLWIGSGKQLGKWYDTYRVYMDESVSGLNLNAQVGLRGVDVGSVRGIELDPENSERVRITLDIERGAPIKEDTIAVLRTQGLTGIAYIDLMGGSRDAPLLEARDPDGYPVIRSAPSLMARLDVALPRLLTNLEAIMEDIGAVLDEENRRSLTQGLADIAEVARTLAARSATIDEGIRDAAQTLENTARSSQALSRLIERMEYSAAAVERIADSAGGMLEDNRDGLRQFTGETLPELQVLVGEIREIAGSLRRTGREIEQDPSILLHGREPAVPGPGE